MASTKTDRAQFAETLKRIRNEQKMTQSDVVHALAEQGIEVTDRAVSGWERQISTPHTRAIVFALDDALRAGGQIVSSLGYATPAGGDSGRNLAAEVDELRARLDALEPRTERRSERR